MNFQSVNRTTWSKLFPLIVLVTVLCNIAVFKLIHTYPSEAMLEKLRISLAEKNLQDVYNDEKFASVSIPANDSNVRCETFMQGGLPPHAKRAPKHRSKTVTVKLKDGLNFRFSEIASVGAKFSIGAEFYSRSGSELMVSELFIYILGTERPEGVVFDVGMNLGYYTQMSAALGYQVHSFELQPFCFQFAYNAAKENNFLDKITPHNAPLSDKKFTIKQRDTQCKSGTFDMSKHETLKGKKGFTFATMETVKLDTVISQCSIDKIALMKMDIDGAEVGALRGFVQALGRGLVQNVILEIGSLESGKIVGSTPEEASEIYQKLFSMFQYIYTESELIKWTKGECPIKVTHWEAMLKGGNILLRYIEPLHCA